MLQLNKRQLAHVLAALRYCQKEMIALEAMPHFDGPDNLQPLDDNAVNQLCEELNTTSQTELTVGIYETPNFVFHSFGESPEHIKKLMGLAWKQHVKEYGANPAYFETDDVNMITARIGEAYRNLDDSHDLITHTRRELVYD